MLLLLVVILFNSNQPVVTDSVEDDVRNPNILNKTYGIYNSHKSHKPYNIIDAENSKKLQFYQGFLRDDHIHRNIMRFRRYVVEELELISDSYFCRL